jgi:hypothetical protein
MSNKKGKQKLTQINISAYQEVFTIITLLSKKYVYPNMPKRYRFKHLYHDIEVGIKYDRDDEYPQRLYFCPNGFGNHSFVSFNMLMEASTYNLEEILDYLYTPQQILQDFYLRLIKFANERKKKIQGLKLVTHLVKIIVENEKEFKT